MNVSENIEKVMILPNLKKLNRELMVKKRHNLWENEVHKTTSVPDSNMPDFNGDRFIPRRYALQNIERNQNCLAKEGIRDVLTMRITANYFRKNAFKLAFDSIFDVKPRRILELTDTMIKKASSLSNTCVISNSNRSELAYDWPCKPRSKPLAHTDSTHEMPGFDAFFDSNRVDWSVNGHIVACFGTDVIVWKLEEDITMHFNLISCPRSVAYCPNGMFLAIGCKSCNYPVLELWDVDCDEFIIANGKVFDKHHKDVRCIEWSKFGNYIACGTHYGTLFVLSVPKLKTISKVRKYNLPITIIKFSPTLRYLASGDIEGNIVIYNWPSCEVYLYVQSRRKLSVTFDWHPWNGIDLIISEDAPASIVILHVPKKEIVGYYQRKDNKITINNVTFSKITAELVVSISKVDDFGCAEYKILVMSSLDQIVDLLKIPGSGARFMMWSPDGTKMATAGDDETLTIWNFFPTYENSKNNSKIAKIKLPAKFEMQKSSIADKFGSQFKRLSCIR